MLFLLPPSETKADGAYPGAIETPLCLGDVSLEFGVLDEARKTVAEALMKLCKDPTMAAQVLGLSAKQSTDIERNRRLMTAPTMMALDRYTGTLFDAVHGRGLKGSTNEFAHLSEQAVERAKQSVLIQSALFGMISATALIPYYRLSANTRIPTSRGGVLNLKQLWAEPHAAVFGRLQGLVIDMRSKAYAELAPVAATSESFFLDVVIENADGSRSSMNHFNKKSKGELLNAVLNAKNPPQTLADLKRIAKSAGFLLEEGERELTLVVSPAGKS